MSTASERRWYAAVASLEVCQRCGAWGVQVSHCNLFRGLGQKSPYFMTAALCPECHHAIDAGNKLTQIVRRLDWLMAWAKTMLALWNRGLIKLEAK